MEQTKWEK